MEIRNKRSVAVSIIVLAWMVAMLAVPAGASQEGRGFESTAWMQTASLVYNYPSAGGATNWYKSDPGDVIDIDFYSTDGDLQQGRYYVKEWHVIFNNPGTQDYVQNWGLAWDELTEGGNEVGIGTLVEDDAYYEPYKKGQSGFLFRKDTTVPGKPTDVHSTSHKIGSCSGDTAIHMAWTDALEPLPGSGLDGYSIEWSQSAGTEPDETKDIDIGVEQATSPEETDGQWYFHIRAVDVAGNWGDTDHKGPFCIETGLAPQWHNYLPQIVKRQTLPAANLTASSKKADEIAVNAGDMLHYTIELKNTGTLGTEATLTDPIPAQAAFVPGSNQDCSYDAGRVSWSGTLDSGTSHICKYSVTANDDAAGSIVNEATVSDGANLTLKATTPVLVTNGGFETSDTTGWQTSGDAVLPAPGVATTDPHDGGHDLLLGSASYCNTADPDAEGDHVSIARQTIYVPDGQGTPTLKFWYRILTYDHLTWTDGRLGDSFDVRVGGELALRDNYENYPSSSPGCDSLRDSGWREAANPWGGTVDADVLNLSEYKSQWVEIQFQVWTREDGYYNTWAYADDVRVEFAP
jgi:uncharacterized repeat protein (TIGR01451 family)